MKIKIGILALVMIFSLFLSSSAFAFATFVAVLLHELGHIAMARLLKIELEEFSLGIFGASLTPKAMITSYKKEMLLSLAGPLVNLISFFIAIPFRFTMGSLPQLFAMSSLFLALLNLLPISGFDGGRILRSLLCHILTLKIADTIMSIVSFFLIFALWSLSVYLLMRVSISLSVFIFSVSLFAKIFISNAE